MALRITLVNESGPERSEGFIDFRSLLVRNPGDYTCQPAAMLTPQQVEDLSWQLRRLPRLVCGRIGPYRWREECDAVPAAT